MQIIQNNFHPLQAIINNLNPLQKVKNCFRPLLTHAETSFNAIGGNAGKKEAIKKIALDGLKELAISLSLTSITCLFVATSAIPTMFATAVTVVALSTLAKTARFLIELEFSDYQFNQQEKNSIITALFFSRLIPHLLLSILDLTTRQVLVHEAGHALTAKALFTNPNVSIEVFPLQGGMTHFSTKILSGLGSILGKQNSELLVTAAGPLAGTILSLVDLRIAHAAKDTHPEIHTQMKINAICNIASHALYAVSAFWNSTPGHDFVYLWKIGGIHPIVSLICIIAIPILYQSYLSS